MTSGFDEPFVPPAAAPGGLLDPGTAAPGGGFSLLGYSDPVLSLLGNVFSGGRIGADQIAGAAGGGSQLAPVQRRSAADALLAAGASLANAGGRRFGPQPTWAQAVTGAMAAGSSAAEEGQTRQLLLDQSQQVLAQSARDAEVRRQLMQKQIEQADLAARVIKAGVSGALGGSGRGGVSPALLPDGSSGRGDAAPSGAAMPVQPGDFPGSGVREALATGESRGAGYGAANSLGFIGRYQLGAALASDAGVYTPGKDDHVVGPDGRPTIANKWTGRFNIPGHLDVQTRDDFLRSPDAQEAAYRIAMSHNDQQLARLGIYDRGAQAGTIGGVPVTREGLLAGAWLGGVGGVRDWVDSRGRINNADINRTRVGDWVKLGAGAAPQGTQLAAAGPPAGTATDAPTPIVPPDQQAVEAAGLTPLPLPAAAAPPPPAPAAGRAGAGLPPTPVPAAAATPPGTFAGVSPQQWAALALVPFGKQGEALAKMLGEPGGETKSIEDPNTHVHWLWRTDRQGNPIARIGLAPTDPKHLNVVSPDKQQVEIHSVLPGGALGPLVGYAPHELQIGEGFVDGKNRKGLYVPPSAPGGAWTFQPIMDSPLPPELAPKPPGRIASNITEQAGIAGATKDEENARKAQTDLYAGRDRAAQTRTQLDMLDALQDPEGKFKTGAITPQLATAGAFAASLGVPLGSIAPGLSPEAAVNAQVFQKITNGLALSHIGPGGLPANTFSEADRNFVSAMGPMLTNTPGANRLITNYMRATTTRQLEQADRWEAWRQDPAHQALPGGPDSAASWRQFQTEWNRYANSNPVVQRLKGEDTDAIKAEVAKLPPGRLWYVIDARGRLVSNIKQAPPSEPAPPPGG